MMYFKRVILDLTAILFYLILLSRCVYHCASEIRHAENKNIAFSNSSHVRNRRQASSFCHYGWHWFSGSCYKFMIELETWDNAEYNCKMKNSLLFAIESYREYEFLHRILNELYNKESISSDQWWSSGRLKHGEWHWHEWKDDDYTIEYWHIGYPRNSANNQYALLQSNHRESWRFLNKDKYEYANYICETKACSGLAAPEFGSISMFGNEMQKTALFGCDTGFTLAGPRVRKCKPYGRWSEKAPLCQKKACGDPGRCNNGYRRFSVVDDVNVVRFGCFDGFTLNGLPTRVCSPSTNIWSGFTPKCEVVKCKNPGVPINGHTSGEIFVYQSDVTFTCERGYQLVGSSKITCLMDGQWNGGKPDCIIQDCGDPGLLSNGNRNGSVFTYGSTVIYECNKGFELIGEQINHCSENGAWRYPLPLCSAILCSTPQSIENGIVHKYNEKTYVGTFSTYTCNEGYFISGEFFLTCLDNGNWDFPTPACLPAACEIPLTPPHGKVWVSGFYENNRFLSGTTLKYYCDKGYMRVGASSSHCSGKSLNGKWSNKSPSCIKCPDGWISFESSCYLLMTKARTWRIAARTCNGKGAKLVAFEDEEEMNFIIKTITDMTEKDRPLIRELWWTSGTSVHNRWIWYDWSGKEVPPSLWYPGQPHVTHGTGPVVSLFYTNELWGLNDVHKHFRLQFICEMSASDYIAPVETTAKNIPTTTEYIPTTTEYIPTTTEYIPTTTEYIPTTTEYIPTTTEYIPTTTEYIPTTAEYLPTTTEYIPTTTENIPTTISFKPDVPMTTQSLIAACQRIYGVRSNLMEFQAFNKSPSELQNKVDILEPEHTTSDLNTAIDITDEIAYSSSVDNLESSLSIDDFTSDLNTAIDITEEIADSSSVDNLESSLSFDGFTSMMDLYTNDLHSENTAPLINDNETTQSLVSSNNNTAVNNYSLETENLNYGTGSEFDSNIIDIYNNDNMMNDTEKSSLTEEYIVDQPFTASMTNDTEKSSLTEEYIVDQPFTASMTLGNLPGKFETTTIYENVTSMNSNASQLFENNNNVIINNDKDFHFSHLEQSSELIPRNLIEDSNNSTEDEAKFVVGEHFQNEKTDQQDLIHQIEQETVLIKNHTIDLIEVIFIQANDLDERLNSFDKTLKNFVNLPNTSIFQNDESRTDNVTDNGNMTETLNGSPGRD